MPYHFNFLVSVLHGFLYRSQPSQEIQTREGGATNRAGVNASCLCPASSSIKPIKSPRHPLQINQAHSTAARKIVRKTQQHNRLPCARSSKASTHAQCKAPIRARERERGPVDVAMAKVEPLTSEMVVPAEETPAGAVWLSNLDLGARRGYTPTVYFYRTTGKPEFFEAEAVKESLARALVACIFI
jgi:hypothetical protein